MTLKLRYYYFLLYALLLKCSATVPIQTASDYVEESLRVRVRRQDGYVYDKPSLSFDLPQRSTSAPTQAPNVDRTLTQQMFYAYPVPAGGADTVNIGQTAGTTATAGTAAPTAAGGGGSGGGSGGGGGGGGAGGYNYRSSTTTNAGYNYGSASTEAQTNTNSQVTNTASQTSGYGGTQIATNTGISQAGSGYGNNVPSPTLSPTLQGSSEVSTNAPKYLPPTGGGAGESIGTGGNVNVGSVSVTSGSGQVTTGTSTSLQTGSVGIPSDSYLPPLGTSNARTSVSTSIQSNTGGSVSVPSTAYLPPNTSSQRSPAPSPGSSSPPAPVPQAGYIPPLGPSSGTVSTPASTYLPPSFF